MSLGAIAFRICNGRSIVFIHRETRRISDVKHRIRLIGDSASFNACKGSRTLYFGDSFSCFHYDSKEINGF